MESILKSRNRNAFISFAKTLPFIHSFLLLECAIGASFRTSVLVIIHQNGMHSKNLEFSQFFSSRDTTRTYFPDFSYLFIFRISQLRAHVTFFNFHIFFNQFPYRWRWFNSKSEKYYIQYFWTTVINIFNFHHLYISQIIDIFIKMLWSWKRLICKYLIDERNI